MSDRVKMVLWVSLGVGLWGGFGVEIGFIVTVLSHRLLAGVVAGVLAAATGVLWTLSRAFPILPWRTWTVTVWFPGGSKSHLRTASPETARKMQAMAHELSQEHGARIEARITKGRRGL